MKMLSALASLRLQGKHITWPSDENQISHFFFFFISLDMRLLLYVTR